MPIRRVKVLAATYSFPVVRQGPPLFFYLYGDIMIAAIETGLETWELVLTIIFAVLTLGAGIAWATIKAITISRFDWEVNYKPAEEPDADEDDKYIAQKIQEFTGIVIQRMLEDGVKKRHILRGFYSSKILGTQSVDIELRSLVDIEEDDSEEFKEDKRQFDKELSRHFREDHKPDYQVYGRNYGDVIYVHIGQIKNRIAKTSLWELAVNSIADKIPGIRGESKAEDLVKRKKWLKGIPHHLPLPSDDDFEELTLVA